MRAKPFRRGDCAYCQTSAKATPLFDGLGTAFAMEHPGEGGQTSFVTQYVISRPSALARMSSAVTIVLFPSLAGIPEQ
jgi:hypothetical protein